MPSNKLWFIEPLVWPLLGSATVIASTQLGSHYELISSTVFVQTSGIASATLILAPMGIARGACGAIQSYVESNSMFDKWMRSSLKPLVDMLPNRNMVGALEELGSLIRKNESSLQSSSILGAEAQGLRGVLFKIASRVVMASYDSILDESIQKIIHATGAHGGPGIGKGEGRKHLLETVCATSKTVMSTGLSAKRYHASLIGSSLFVFSFAFILSADYVIGLAKRNNELYGHSYNQRRITQMEEQDKQRGPAPLDTFTMKVQAYIDGFRK